MGRDKALLQVGGQTMLDRVARVVAEAAGSVTLIGDPAKYGSLGFPVVADIVPGYGPLGGIMTAISVSPANWNLVLACDMPEVRLEFLRTLVEIAEKSASDCLLPCGESDRPEPLCGVYHRRALPAIQQALQDGIRKVTAGLAGLEVELLQIEGPGPFRNINTQHEWLEYTGAQVDKTPAKPI